MKRLAVLLIGSFALVSLAPSIRASERIRKIYRISETSAADLENSPFILTVTSNDLSQFPRSVVTFYVTTDLKPQARTLASVDPAGKEGKPEPVAPRYRAKRHYLRIGKDEFGRSGKTHVLFDKEKGTVFLDFVGQGGKTYYFKEVVQH